MRRNSSKQSLTVIEELNERPTTTDRFVELCRIYDEASTEELRAKLIQAYEAIPAYARRPPEASYGESPSEWVMIKHRQQLARRDFECSLTNIHGDIVTQEWLDDSFYH